MKIKMTVERANIFNIQHYSLQDGPGIRTTVFFKGCPLHCRWCCNPESQSFETETMGDSIAGKQMTVEEILREVEKDEIFYRHGNGGITVSGGEPLAQGEFTVELLREAKKRYISTAIETSGYVSEEILLDAAKYLDTVYFDIKSLDEEKHKQWIGASNKSIVNNLRKLKAVYPSLTVIVRTPVIPGFNDTEDDIRLICSFLKNIGQTKYQLLPYHRFGKSKYEKLGIPYPMGEARLEEGTIEKLKEVVKEYGLVL